MGGLESQDGRNININYKELTSCIQLAIAIATFASYKVNCDAIKDQVKFLKYYTVMGQTRNLTTRVKEN